jgi:hypothetical protein
MEPAGKKRRQYDGTSCLLKLHAAYKSVTFKVFLDYGADETYNLYM